jgi:YlmC/YmxH family sporulation protein
LKVSLYDLKQKQVVNVIDGRILGSIDDFEVDDKEGKIITAIIPSGGSGFFSFFGRGEEYIIPWSCIKKVGEDTILVEYKDDLRHRNDEDDDED